MSRLTIQLSEPKPLLVELQRPLKELSLVLDEHGRMHWFILSRDDGSGMRLSSQMHDLAERVEVGVLSVNFDQRVELSMYDQMIVTTRPFQEEVQTANKLVVHEEGIDVESGLALKLKTGKELIILPGVFPYSTTIRGDFQLQHTFDPEYPLDRYARVPLH